MKSWPRRNSTGRRVDPRQRALALAVQPVVDQPREADVDDDEAEQAQADADAEPMMAQCLTRRRRGRVGGVVSAAPVGRGAVARDVAARGRPACRLEQYRVSRRDHRVDAEVERQLLGQPVDERRAVLVQEVDHADLALLRVPARKRLRLRVLELPPQRLVLALGRLDDLGCSFLRSSCIRPERRARGALERRVDRRPPPRPGRSSARRVRAARRRRPLRPPAAARLRAARSAPIRPAAAAIRTARRAAQETRSALASTSVADARGWISGIGTPNAS